MTRRQAPAPSARSPEIRVVISASDALMRSGVACLLKHSGHVRVVGGAGSVDDALPVVRAEQPDIALVILGSRATDDLGALERLRGEHTEIGIAVVIGLVDRRHVVESMRLGVRAILTRDATSAELADAVREAHAGRRYLHPAAASVLLDDLAVGGDPTGVAHDGLGSLSVREREVFDLLVLGRSSPEIASALGISQHTSDTHRRRVMTKLGLGSPVDLVKFAIRHGLLSLED